MNRRLILSIILLTLFLAACGNLDPPPPTNTPLPTIRVISSPLPPISTEAPAGFDEDNPMQFVIVAADAEASAEQVGALTDAINAETDIVVNAEVGTTGTAVEALCNPNGRLVAAYVDGLTYAVASLRGCGLPAFKRIDTSGNVGRASIIIAGFPEVPVESENEGDEAEDGEEVETQIIEPSLETVAAGTYCRISATDVYSWQLPAIAFQAAGISLTDFQDIQSYETYEELIVAVESGDCSGAGVPVDIWQASDAVGLRELETTAEAPFNVLMFASGGALEAVENVSTGIQDAFDANPSLFAPFFGSGTLEAIGDGDTDLENIRSFLTDTNLDFTQLGN